MKHLAGSRHAGELAHLGRIWRRGYGAGGGSDRDRIVPLGRCAAWIDDLDADGIRTDKVAVGLIGNERAFPWALVACRSRIVPPEARVICSLLHGKIAMLRRLDDPDGRGAQR